MRYTYGQMAFFLALCVWEARSRESPVFYVNGIGAKICREVRCVNAVRRAL